MDVSRGRRCLLVFVVSLLFVDLGVVACAMVGSGPAVQVGVRSVGRGNVLFVGGFGPGNYSRIQDAIDNATAGDTVFVYHGVYSEYIKVDKSLHVVGEDRNNTVISAPIMGAVLISGDGVVFEGFTVLNNDSTEMTSAIYISGSGCIVTGNIVLNTVKGRDYGIIVSGEGNTVAKNMVSNHTIGIFIFYSSGSRVEDNLAVDNDATGIAVTGSTTCSVLNNTVLRNYAGIRLFDARLNTVRGNLVKGSHDGIYLTYNYNRSVQNVISQNTFQENRRDAFFQLPKGSHERNTWDANYWERPYPRPKLIGGAKAWIVIPGVPFHFPGGTVFLPWLAIDWHPAQQPYSN